MRASFSCDPMPDTTQGVRGKSAPVRGISALPSAGARGGVVQGRIKYAGILSYTNNMSGSIVQFYSANIDSFHRLQYI